MGKPIIYTLELAAADADIVAEAQTLAGADDFALDGTAVSNGVAILDTPRRIIITSSGDDTGITFTVYGNQRTDGSGNDISETVTGTNGSAVSTSIDFGTVTRVASSGATDGDAEVGTNGVASTPWILCNYHGQPVNFVVSGKVNSGSVNYTGEYTYDDFMVSSTPPTAWADPLLTAQTGNADSTMTYPVTGYRFTINSGTGNATFTFIQAGIKG